LSGSFFLSISSGGEATFVALVDLPQCHCLSQQDWRKCRIRLVWFTV